MKPLPGQGSLGAGTAPSGRLPRSTPPGAASSQHLHEAGVLTIPVLRVRKLGPRGVLSPQGSQPADQTHSRAPGGVPPRPRRGEHLLGWLSGKASYVVDRVLAMLVGGGVGTPAELDGEEERKRFTFCAGSLAPLLLQTACALSAGAGPLRAPWRESFISGPTVLPPSQGSDSVTAGTQQPPGFRSRARALAHAQKRRPRGPHPLRSRLFSWPLPPRDSED